MLGLPAAAAGGAAKPIANKPKAMHTTNAKVFRNRIIRNPILCGGRTRVFGNKGIGAKINKRAQKGTLNPNWGAADVRSGAILDLGCSDLPSSTVPPPAAPASGRAAPRECGARDLNPPYSLGKAMS